MATCTKTHILISRGHKTFWLAARIATADQYSVWNYYPINYESVQNNHELHKLELGRDHDS